MSIRILTLAAMLLGSGAVHAVEPENYIAYREAVMKAIAGHMGASTQIVRGRIPAGDDLAMHAQALEKLTADIARLFPDGSDFGETKATPAVWEKRAEFDKAAIAARDAGSAFAAAVAGGDSAQIAAAHRELGQSCKGCHEDFRQKDD